MLKKKGIQEHIKRFHSMMKNYREIIILLYAIWALFGSKPMFFGIYNKSVYLLFIPLLMIILLFGDKLKDYGFGIGDWKKTLLYTVVVSLLAAGVVFVSMLILPGVQSYYSGYSFNLERVRWTVLYMLGWEFIFRGFLLFGLRGRLGDKYANIIQTLLFFLTHLGKPAAELYSTLITGLIFGYICLRSRSYLPMVVVHSVIMLSAILFASL